jgi:hypothetical protein
MAEKQIKLANLIKGTDYKEIPKEVKQHSDILLAKGKKIVLQADSKENARGLVVTWRADGGYDVAYWYDTPNNIVPAELKGDGKSFGDIKNVYLGFHPELDEDYKDD